MSSDPFQRWPELDPLFERALDVAPEKREAWLEHACAGDAALRRELERLLAAVDETENFLEDASAWLGERPAGLSAHSADRRIGRTYSHYEVLEPLGEGGMGVLYRARDTRLDRTVTLKFIQPLLGADPEAKTRFIREARAASALDHTGICTIYEIDETEDGQLFIAMAYYAGETLAERLKRGPLQLEEAFETATAIGRGLACAHEAGIVHRDLKPANVMLTERGEVRVLDFGIAKLEGQDQTRTGARLGTAAYMSPEQAAGRTVDRRADIWALGAVLYESVTGRRPFACDNETATIHAILHEEPEPIAKHRPDAPAALEPVVRRALAKDVAERYPEMEAFLADLQAVRAGTAPPAMRALRRGPTATAHHTRRRWLLGTALAALLLVPLTILGVRLAGGAAVLRAFLARGRQDPVPFEARDRILITDLQNRTGEAVFDRSLNSAIDVAIGQSQYVNVYPRSRVEETLLRMGRTDRPVLDEALALEVAVRENLAAVLVFEISNIDSAYVLTTRIVDPLSGFTTRTETTRAAGRAGVLEAVDELATRLRVDLGESLRSIRRNGVRLPDATTRSLEALKRHADGAVAWGEGNWRGAQTLWREAVALDSGFAWAHASLGLATQYLDGADAARPHFETARSLLDHVTERERLWIRSLISDPGEAITALRTYTQLYPGDRAAWYNLGNNLRQENRAEEALQAYRSALAVDSMCAWCWVNTAMAFVEVGRNRESADAFERAFALQPSLRTNTSGAINRTYGFVLVRLGDPAGAEAVFRELLPRDPSDRAFGLRSLGLLAMYQGRAALAIRHIEDATTIARSAGAPVNEYMNLLYLGTAYRMKGRSADARRALDRARRIASLNTFWPDVLTILGKQLARNGELQAADGVLGLLQAAAEADGSLLGRADVEQLQGELSLARGEFDAARRTMESAYALWPSPDRLESLARARLAAGSPEEAAAAFAEFLTVAPLGTDRQEYWLAAHATLADIHERLGEPAQALQRLTRLVDLWKHADPDLPALHDVRDRIARLEAQRPDAGRSRDGGDGS